MNRSTLPKAFSTSAIQLWTARPDGALAYVNEGVLSYFGRTYEQMIEWGWAECVHQDDLGAVAERWSASLESGEPYLVQFRLRRHDDIYRWHIGAASPHFDDSGDIILWTGANLLSPRIEDD